MNYLAQNFFSTEKYAYYFKSQHYLTILNNLSIFFIIFKFSFTHIIFTSLINFYYSFYFVIYRNFISIYRFLLRKRSVNNYLYYLVYYLIIFFKHIILQPLSSYLEFKDFKLDKIYFYLAVKPFFYFNWQKLPLNFLLAVFSTLYYNYFLHFNFQFRFHTIRFYTSFKYKLLPHHDTIHFKPYSF